MLTPNKGDPLSALVEARLGLFSRDVLLEVRRLVLTALVTWILYSLLMRGSKDGCADASLDSTDASVVSIGWACPQWTLAPSPFVGLAVACLMLWALGRIARGAYTEQQASVLLHRAGRWVIAIPAVSLLIAQVWFWALPMPGETDVVFFPFPFGTVDVFPDPDTLYFAPHNGPYDGP